MKAEKIILATIITSETLPAEGSTIEPCSGCHIKVWLSLETRKAAGSDARILCLRCAETILYAEDDVEPVFLPISIGRKNELLDALMEQDNPEQRRDAKGRFTT